jgi:hypothetical protein
MRGIAILLAGAACAWSAEPIQVQSVYLLPMSGGMEQYLAQRLTREGVFAVVTDPKLADAVMSDQIGAGFERRMADLYPVVEAKPEAKTDPKADPKDKKAAEDEKLREELKLAGGQRPTPAGFSKGQGNFFLVELKSRRVVWSDHERAKNSRPEEMDKASARIVGKLLRALGRGK